MNRTDCVRRFGRGPVWAREFAPGTPRIDCCPHAASRGPLRAGLPVAMGADGSAPPRASNHNLSLIESADSKAITIQNCLDFLENLKLNL